MIIRRLAPSHAIAYRRLRLGGLRESPTAFGSAYAEEAKLPFKTFATRLAQTDDKWTFGAFENERLVGIVTLIRDEKSKVRHKASIYGMYVERKSRRQGVGRQLIQSVVEAAHRLRGLKQVRLAVAAANRPALRLYEKAGFKVYGREEDALFVAGKFHAELFLVLRLAKPKPSQVSC